MSIDTMDDFTRQYIVTALWSSIGDNDKPMDDTHTIDDFSPEAIETIEADCARFQAENSAVLESLYDTGDHNEDIIGHDFWLTRNGHGAGFWDGDYPEPMATALTDACKAFGECSLYIGDDKQVHIM